MDVKPDLCADLNARLGSADNAEQAFARWVQALDVPADKKASLVAQFQQGEASRHAAVREYASLTLRKQMTKVPAQSSHK